MDREAEREARGILTALQAAVDARDVDRLLGLFDEPAVLVGAGGDGRNRERLVGYLTAVATQPESLLWEWSEIVPFHHEAGVLGFAAFGEIAIRDESGEDRRPFRLTVVAARGSDGWRVRQFHGSIPAAF